MFEERKLKGLKETLIICGYDTEFANAFTNALEGNLDIKGAGILIAFSQDKDQLEDFKDLLSGYLSSKEEATTAIDLAFSNAFSIAGGKTNG